MERTLFFFLPCMTAVNFHDYSANFSFNFHFGYDYMYIFIFVQMKIFLYVMLFCVPHFL